MISLPPKLSLSYLNLKKRNSSEFLQPIDFISSEKLLGIWDLVAVNMMQTFFEKKKKQYSVVTSGSLSLTFTILILTRTCIPLKITGITSGLL